MVDHSCYHTEHPSYHTNYYTEHPSYHTNYHTEHPSYHTNYHTEHPSYHTEHRVLCTDTRTLPLPQSKNPGNAVAQMGCGWRQMVIAVQLIAHLARLKAAPRLKEPPL